MIAALAALALAQAAPAYQPTASDERGLWMEVDEAERELRTSDFVLRDPTLNAYVRGVLCRTVGPACADIRLYILRTPYFNAETAPNGMIELWSGAFLRCRNEAELAAVLAHEVTHYQRRHSIALFRSVKRKSDAFGIVSAPLGFFTAGLGSAAAEVALEASIYSYSRDQEREADAASVGLLARAGYDPHAAPAIWRNVLAERDATASQRRWKPRGDGGLFADHPSSAERLTTLAALTEAQPLPPHPALNRDAYRAALAPFWAQLVDDQVKLNDFGGTDLLLDELAADGWTPDLLYARGELYRARGRAADLVAAVGFYRQALAAPGAPVEARRGLGLALLRSGDRTGGAAALRAYLTAAPTAADAPMLRVLVS